MRPRAQTPENIRNAPHTAETRPPRKSRRRKRRADGTQLGAEGMKLRAEDIKLNAEDTQLSAVGMKLDAGGTQLRAEGTQLGVEGTQLRAHGIKRRAACLATLGPLAALCGGSSATTWPVVRAARTHLAVGWRVQNPGPIRFPSLVHDDSNGQQHKRTKKLIARLDSLPIELTVAASPAMHQLAAGYINALQKSVDGTGDLTAHFLPRNALHL